nr:DnaJ homolog subfamily C member 7-like isoform X1 [Ipomoea batatas]
MGNEEGAEYESCVRWRIRGNQAFKAGNVSKAENLYTEGIECCVQPLLLCYSNRGAALMSLRRMREAINDLAVALALDPSFLKAKLRAATCYLLLGEVQEAMQYYKSCMESRTGVCLDRRIAIEAANGLQKAEKVAESLHRSAELLKQQTCDAASSALEIIADALSISSYSEKLLEMKGECLCKLQKYDEAIKLCEQTLDFAEKNFALHDTENKNDSIRLWRWRIMSKSYYHLGKLTAALHLIKKQEQVIFVNDGSGNKSQKSLIPLGTTIRELLAHRKAGNKAFQSGKFAEALDHYNAAISKSVESQPFAAICFCNRAAAHQGLGQIIDAIADCSVAMALDENYAKAASRRATLHEMIRDYVDAVTDLKRLISLLENEAQEKAGSFSEVLRKARQRLSSVEEKAKSQIPLDLYLILGIKSSDPGSVVKKAYKKAALKHHPDKVLRF